MQVSEYRLLTPKRSDNSNNSFNSPQLNLRKLSYYLFIVRQSDEVGGQNGKHVCLDECHEKFEAIHEYAEKDTDCGHRGTHGGAHLCGDKDHAGQSENDDVSCHDVGKETDGE